MFNVKTLALIVVPEFKDHTNAPCYVNQVNAEKMGSSALLMLCGSYRVILFVFSALH